jgi:GTP:adenosylcobinamide-phosphate guanylyltransferase
MIRSKLWFRCAAMHDPVTPIIVKPAVISWDAKERDVELSIERAFKGDELVMRMKGWVTVEVKKVVESINKYGYLKVLDERNLVVDVETEEDYEKLNKELEREFKDQLNLERV